MIIYQVITHPVKIPATKNPIESRKYEPGFIDAARGARDRGKKNDVPNAVDIFHDIKKGDRGRPGFKAGDECSVNPETGEVKNGVGETIGHLGDEI